MSGKGEDGGAGLRRIARMGRDAHDTEGAARTTGVLPVRTAIEFGPRSRGRREPPARWT